MSEASAVEDGERLTGSCAGSNAGAGIQPLYRFNNFTEVGTTSVSSIRSFEFGHQRA